MPLPSLSPSIPSICSAFFLSAFPAPIRESFSCWVISRCGLLSVAPSVLPYATESISQLGERGWGAPL